MASETLYEKHIMHGLKKFGRKAMENANIAAVEEPNGILSIVIWKGKRWMFATDKVGKRVIHTVEEQK